MLTIHLAKPAEEMINKKYIEKGIYSQYGVPITFNGYDDITKEMCMALRLSLDLFLLSLLLTNCQGGADEVVTANQAIEVGNAYLQAQAPRNLSAWAIEPIDMGDRWRLSYTLPAGSAGGHMIVVVNKRSGKVVHMEAEQ
jgi:hypothetical protein